MKFEQQLLTGLSGNRCQLTYTDETLVKEYQPVISALISNSELPYQTEIIKQDKTSLVTKVAITNEVSIVLKKDNRRLKIKTFISTLFGRSTFQKYYKDMHLLQSHGIPCPKPYFLLNILRDAGQVDYYICYQYINGESCPVTHVKSAFEVLAKVHRNGLLHGEPHLLNFIQASDNPVKIYPIDFNLRKSQLHFIRLSFEKYRLAKLDKELYESLWNSGYLLKIQLSIGKYFALRRHLIKKTRNKFKSLLTPSQVQQRK